MDPEWQSNDASVIDLGSDHGCRRVVDEVFVVPLVRAHAFGCDRIAMALQAMMRGSLRSTIDTLRKKLTADDHHPLSPDQRGDIATNMRDSRHDHAIRRWVIALNARGTQASIESAVHPDCVVERFGFGTKSGVLVEMLQGAPAVAEWFDRSPQGTVFEIAGPVVLDPDQTPEVARARYAFEVATVTGGGQWTFRVHDDGRVIWLEHAPDDIADPVEEGGHRGGSDREHHDHPHSEGHHHH